MTTTRWRTWFVAPVALALLTMVLAVAGGNAVAATPPPTPAPTSTTAGGPSGATWQWHHTELDAVACWSANDCLAVGKGSQAQRTTDGGGTWVQHDPGVALLSGIACVSGPSCLAVGRSATGDQLVARTTDGGTTWNSGTATVGASLACLSATVCVSPIDSTTVARTTDGGLSWTSVATGAAAPTAPTEWAACGAATCVVAGSTGTILQTADDGITWTSTAAGIDRSTINSVACFSTRCLVLGVLGYAAVTLTSGDGGATWTPFQSDGGAGPAACVSVTRCIAGGGRNVTDDAGATWQASAPIPIDGASAGLACAPGICALVTKSGAIARSSDAGATWSASRVGLALNAKAVSCPAASRCIALRTYGGGALTSDDGGANWAVAAGLTGQDRLSCAPGTGHCVAASSTSASMVSVSDDFGATWTPSSGITRLTLSCPTAQRCTSFSWTSFDGGWSFVPAENVGVAFDLSCPTATHCVGVSSSSTVTSDDGGLTWAVRYSPVGPLRRVSCVSATECLAAGDAPASGQAAVVIGSHDGGVTWAARTAPTGAQTLSSVSCATAADCVAVGSVAGAANAIFRTSDGGSTWSTDVAVPSGNPYATYETGVSCVAAGRCVVVDGDGVWTLGAPVTPAPSEVPGAPTAVTAIGGAGSASVTWTPPAPNGSPPITGYVVTASPGGRSVSVSTPGPLIFPGLAAGVSTTFSVTAVGPLGTGPVSGPSNVVVPTSGVPAPPVSFFANGENKALYLHWGAPQVTGGTPITDYVVTVMPGNIVSHTGTTTWTSVAGLTNGVAYSATVVAVNAQGPSAAASLGGAYPHVDPGPITGLLASAGDASAFVTWNPIPDGGAPIEGGTLILVSGNEHHDVSFTGTPQPTVVTGLTNGVTYQTSLYAWTDRGWGYTGATGPTVTPQAGATFGARYHPLAPTRVLDSRGPTGGWNARLTAGSPRDLQVTGLGGATSVPATASAVVLNVTATNSTAGSFLSVWPTGSTQPVSSNLNFAAGETIANLVTVKIGAGGKLRFADAVGATDVVADLVGYYDDGTQPGDRFTSIVPERALDTRGPHLTPPYTRLVAGFPHELPLAGHGSVPSTATAVVANVTVTDATAGSFLTVWPTGSPKPTSSSLNFAAGETIANLVVMPLGAGGAISLANAVGATDVIVDVVGYFDPNAGATFHALAPIRVLDDRVGNGSTGPWGPGETRAVAVGGVGTVPSGATAIVGNLTATNASMGSFVTAFPHGSSRPIASTVNFGPYQTIPNAVITGLNADQVDLANELGSVDLVLDVAGYYATP